MGFNIGGGIGGYFGNKATNAQIAANNRLSIINAKTGNDLRQAANAAKSAEGNLARFVQSINNNRALEAGGNAQEALVVNARRRGDSQLTGDFSSTIRNAEQAGASAAAAAVAGIDGSVVDMVNGSTALRDSIVRQSVDDRQSQEAYDVSRRAGNIMSQMVASLDSSVIMDSLDYNIDVSQERPELSGLAAAIRGFFPAALDASLGAASNNNGKTTGTDSASQYLADTNRRKANALDAGLSVEDFNENYSNEGRNKANFEPQYGDEGDRETSLWSVDEDDYSDLWSR